MKRVLINILLTACILSVAFYSCKSDDDTDLPYILLDGANPLYIDSIGGTFKEPGYHGLDDIDGDLTSFIKVEYPVIGTDSARSYEAIYSLTDKSGNTFTTHRTIVVRNTAWFLEGFYSKCTQYCDSDTTLQFAASVIASVVSNDNFYIRNFGNFGQDSLVSCSIDRSTGKINIPVPQWASDSVTIDAVIADSNYVTRMDTLNFQVYYTRTKMTVPWNCRTFYRR